MFKLTKQQEKELQEILNKKEDEYVIFNVVHIIDGKTIDKSYRKRVIKTLHSNDGTVTQFLSSI